MVHLMEMLKKGKLTAHLGFIFLGLLSSVICDESLSLHDVDLGGLFSSVSFLQEKCFEYPDLPLCLNWKFFQEGFPNQDLLPHLNSETIPENNSEKNGKEEPITEMSFLDAERPLKKRFAIFGRKNLEAQSFKRGPGFRSWGGKRDPAYSSQLMEKKSKFTSWGGKRNYDATKDIMNPDTETGDSEKKRAKFVSWGGKRNDQNLLNKRSKFRSWGGKKRDVENPVSYDQFGKKGSFWKLTDNFDGPFKKQVPKRPHFQSWGGKRAMPIWKSPPNFYYYQHPSARYDLRKLLNNEGKRTFSSWGGKRGGRENHFDSIEELWAEKPLNNFKKSQNFQSKEGKKIGESQEIGDLYEIFLKPDELLTFEKTH